MADNNKIVELIKRRLNVGQKEYGHEIDVNDGRDWLKESLEEQLDSIVYTAAALIQIQKKTITNHGPPYSMANTSGKKKPPLSLSYNETEMLFTALEEMSSTLYISGENAKSSEYSGLLRKLKKSTNHKEKCVVEEECETCD
tara:strand:+ start:583 stop:1008 length:426 start_codon:yes stop_codon:yes gene_type:complete